MNGVLVRIVTPIAAAATLCACAIGTPPQATLPPVRAVFYLDLTSLWNPLNPTTESRYAQDLAAQFEQAFT